MQAHEYRGAGDPSEDVLIFTVSTSAAAQGTHSLGDAADSKAPPLPSGTLVPGLAAALMSHRQVTAERCSDVSSGFSHDVTCCMYDFYPAIDHKLHGAQVRSQQGTLLLGVQMGQLPDAKFLHGFAAATARRLSRTGVPPPTRHWRIGWRYNACRSQ